MFKYYNSIFINEFYEKNNNIIYYLNNIIFI